MSRDADKVESCPMCQSTFDDRKFKLVNCEECGAEGSDACCVTKINGGDYYCVNCQDDN